jgi:2-methylcitrate dehydratase PrpD
LRNQHGLTADQVARITVRAHPLVQELTGKKTPQTGLESKFSVFHSCAVAIIKGQAGEHAYSDEMVLSPATIALRDRVELVVDRAIHEASVDVTIETTDGRSLHIDIERAIGSLEKPMTDVLLKAKFVDQSEPIIGQAQSDTAWNLCMSLAAQPDLKAVLQSLTRQA